MKILLVEDHDQVRNLLEGFLRDFDHEVKTASNGKEAFDIIETGPSEIDVVISDNIMPVMSGIDLSRKIRRSGYDVPFFLMTAHSDNESIIQSLNFAMDGFLIKPLGVDDIRGILHKAQEMKDMREHNGRYAESPVVSGSSVWRIKSELTSIAPYLVATRPEKWMVDSKLFLFLRRPIEMMLQEACRNAIIYGSYGIKSDPLGPRSDNYTYKEVLRLSQIKELSDKEIAIKTEIEAGKITLRVCDGGPGFNYEALLAQHVARRLQNGHRGISLISALADKLSWNDAGNEISFEIHERGALAKRLAGNIF